MFESDLCQKYQLLKTRVTTFDFIMDNIAGTIKKYKAILDDK